MKAYRMTQQQLEALQEIHAHLEDYVIQDRRSRIIASDLIKELIEEIQKDSVIEIHNAQEKQKAAEKPAALDKAVSPPIPSGV